jgi:hypothetical protein
MSDCKGYVVVKKNLTKTDCLCCKPEDIVDNVVQVLDIAVDNSGYLCLAKRNNQPIGLVDIHKDDVEKFIPTKMNIDTFASFIETILKTRRS